MSEEVIICPQCKSEYGYFDGQAYNCPECSNEWTNADLQENSIKVVDAYGTELKDGDDVVVIKDLKVKGASNPIKQGQIVKGITLVDEAGHNISCKIPNFGAMNLKSEFVKKS